ncbi:GTP diphosphokinase [Gammaproteobacteria bacterium 42_54_T18]|nr:GTP diphosphokinase [Gammaproteobacteria bacterium 42_54_T18]
MVKVRDVHKLIEEGDINLQDWLQRLQEKVEISDPEGLMKLAELSYSLEQNMSAGDNLWVEGASSFNTGLEMAEILADLHMDTDCLKAAVIYRAVREGQTTLAEVVKVAGEGIANLIDGVLQMAAISAVMNADKRMVLGQSSNQLENLRRMLVAMVDDVRVALIKLAERTCAIRAVKDAPEEKKQKVAKEVFDVYAPLAHRLGIGHIKWELEDLSFRYLQPHAYKKIARLLDEKRLVREDYITTVIDNLQTSLGSVGIDGDISGRAKHIFSIWRKMKRKRIDFYQVYDVRAVRVLVPEVRDCYAVLGIVHNLWQHIPKEFDDYIAAPKENGYRSLHTAVLGPDGKVLEVQIRTQDMHDEAELGVCAHWRYKEGSTKSRESYEDKITWLRQVLEWQEELGDTDVSSVISQFSEDIVEERVYVFTPDGHVVDLAQGATPLDFAYHVHTEVGHSCRGAKVNGRIVPLTYTLKTGEQVTIIKSNEAKPSRDWLNPSLGYLGTARARAKAIHWFKRQDRTQNIVDGKAILEKEFQRLDVGKIDLNDFTQAFSVKSVEDIYAAVGAGDLRVGQVLNAIQSAIESEPEQGVLPFDLRKPQVNKSDTDFTVDGVSNILTNIAGCCKPVPGDDVIGYVSYGRGVTVHRDDCIELKRLMETNRERVVEVNWSKRNDRIYSVEIFVKAYDRQGLLMDVTSAITHEKVNLTAVNTSSDYGTGTATMLLTVEVPSLECLGSLLGKINQLPNVVDVKRYHASGG